MSRINIKIKIQKESKNIILPRASKAAEIAHYYGFENYETPEITKQDLSVASDLMSSDFVENEGGDTARLPLHAEEKIAVLRSINCDAEGGRQLFMKSPFKGQAKKDGLPRHSELEILGTSKSIAEALLIKTSMAILESYGISNLHIEINSVGDRDSQARFLKEIGNYLKKNASRFPENYRHLLKNDPFEFYAEKCPELAELREHAPKSTSCLSEASRTHFHEVLEYIEAMDIPYRVNHCLLGNRKYCTETIFEIVSVEEDANGNERKTTHAVGVRYNTLAKRLGAKRDIPAVGVSLFIKEPDKELKERRLPKPKMYCAHIGFEAKVQSLRLIDILRKVRTPILHTLVRDKLSAQLQSAENRHMTHAILVGKKEAVENSVILRDLETYSQVTVPLSTLIDHLKDKGLASFAVAGSALRIMEIVLQ